MSIMDTCPNCEKILLSDYDFCPRCGYSILSQLPPKVEDNREIKFFNVAQNLSTASNVDTLLLKIGEAVENILNAERSSIFLLDDEKKNLFFKTATGEDILKKLTIPLGKGIAGWIAQTRKSEIVNDPYNNEKFSSDIDKATGFKTKSIIGVPMISGNELIGVVEAINKRDGDFTNCDMDILSGFAGLAAVSIVNLKLKTDQKNLYANMLDFLVMASDSLSGIEPTPKKHSWEMAALATLIGKEIGLPVEKQRLLQNAAFIHDIGFLGIENTELVGIKIDVHLTDEAKYRLHPVIGSEMIKGIKMMKDLAPFILYHHRYKNGEGFPENLPVSDITPEIEIISILENYFLTKKSGQIPSDRFSPDIYTAFKKIIT